MIHLDTNFIIGAAKKGGLAGMIRQWLLDGEIFATSAISWSEFLSGPVTPLQIRHANYLMEGRIVPFDATEAAKAAELFNRAGRKRTTRFDCFIAATAICAGASLATENRKDFLPFVPSGLRLS
jgi:predicted nucleic acid-binding protein